MGQGTEGNLAAWARVQKGIYLQYTEAQPRQVGPCHHGVARPQTADGGTACTMEGSCEYSE